jgi:hypothetical protein
MMPGWNASFKDLREAGVTLQEWLEYHKGHKNEQD